MIFPEQRIPFMPWDDALNGIGGWGSRLVSSTGNQHFRLFLQDLTCVRNQPFWPILQERVFQGTQVGLDHLVVVGRAKVYKGTA